MYTFNKLNNELAEMIVNSTNRVTILNTYLQSKQVEGDYHAVADAAMDIREHQAIIRVLNDVLNFLRRTV